MPARSEATVSEPPIEVVPTEQAVAAPPAAPVDPPTPPAPPAPSPRRAHFKGRPNEYLTPLLLAERDPANPQNVTERIFYTPARDLTEEEWQAMPPEHREYVRRAGGRLYDVATDAQMRGEKRTAKGE